VRETAAIGVVLRILSDASVFRAGGVLVGTQAFTAIANMLGVSFVVDVDVDCDTVPLALKEPAVEQPRTYGIDSREPSTSVKVRGRDLRVDFLTPAARSGSSTKPVYLPPLRVAAQPLAGLDYVIDGSVDAAVIAGTGIRVNVPAPARFALHKLW